MSGHDDPREHPHDPAASEPSEPSEPSASDPPSGDGSAHPGPDDESPTVSSALPRDPETVVEGPYADAGTTGPTRWQRVRGRANPASWSRRGAAVGAGVAGLVVGVLLTGVLVATTPLGHDLAGTPHQAERNAAGRHAAGGKKHHGQKAAAAAQQGRHVEATTPLVVLPA